MELLLAIFDYDRLAETLSRVDAELGTNRVWEATKDVWSVLRPMRFCVFVGIAITVLILLVPQSQDALLALLQDVFLREGAGLASGLGNAASFAVLAFFWAFQTFYWARFVSRLPPRPRTPHCYRPPLLADDRLAVLNERLPHWLGALVLISAWLALFRAMDVVTQFVASSAPPRLTGARWSIVALNSQ